MDILGKKNVPDVELSDDDLNALGGLSKTTASGLSYNPYQKIDPKFLELNKFDEEDDEDWLYTTEEQKPRSRHEKLFINVGSAALAGGFFGLLSAGAVLRQRKFLNLKSFKHPVKRSEIITAIVNNCRLRSGQFGSFGFWTGGSAAMLDLQSIKSYMTPLGMTIGQCNLSVAATASVGGFTYGLLGSKTYSNDILRTKPKLLKMFPDGSAKPKMYQMNQRLEYQILSMVKARETVPKWINWSTAFGRCALLGATAYTVTWGIDKLVQAKFMREVKRYKW